MAGAARGRDRPDPCVDIFHTGTEPRRKGLLRSAASRQRNGPLASGTANATGRLHGRRTSMIFWCGWPLVASRALWAAGWGQPEFEQTSAKPHQILIEVLLPCN